MKKENSEFEKPKLLEVEDLTLKSIEANKKIKKEEKERLRIMSDITHDLRAPITALRSSVDCIISLKQNDKLTEEELDKIGNVPKTANR